MPNTISSDSAIKISARNQLRGTIKGITGDAVLSEVVIDLGGGNEVVSVITTSSVTRLGLKEGNTATAIIKSTDVLLAV